MRLWTFQNKGTSELLKLGEPFRCKKDLAKNLMLNDTFAEIFRKSYDYMMNLMDEKIGEAPSGVVLPIWAWHTSGGHHKKPDLRSNNTYYDDSELIELEVPDSQVLLTDFDLWHSVLMNTPILPDSIWEAWDNGTFNIDNISEEEKKSSWKQILDVRSKDWIQACFWEIRPEFFRKNFVINRKIRG